MMRMSRRGMASCLALFLVLTSVSAIKKLNSIQDLKRVNFGQSVPEHSLVLLHWFANTVTIDSNNVIWLTFDPNGDYGSHPYNNFERLLDPLPQGQQDYTVGNLNLDTSVPLPPYVVNHQMDDTGRNRARILIRVRGNQRIDQVHITQHYAISQNRRPNYDPQQTYRVTPNLLRQIQMFSVETQSTSLSELRDRFGSTADDCDLGDIRNTWGDLASLGLLLCIVMQGSYSENKYRHNRLQQSARNPKSDFKINIPEERQNHLESDTSNCCLYLCLIIIIVILVIMFILFSHVSR